MHKTIGHIISIFLTQWGVLFLSVVTSILMARNLGPEGRGILALVLLVPAFLQKIGSLGIGDSAIYYLGKSPHLFSPIAFQIIFLVTLSSGLMVVLFALLFPLLSKNLIKGIPSSYLVVALISLPFNLLIVHFGDLFLAIGEISLRNFLNILNSFLRLLFLFVALIIIKGYVLEAVAALTIVAIFTAIFSFYHIVRYELPNPKIETNLIQKLVSYGIKGEMANIIMFFNYRLDMFLVNLWCGRSEVGYYIVAVLLAEMLWQIPHAVTTVLFPKFSSKDKKEAGELTATSCRYTTLLLFLLCVILALLAHPLIRIFYGRAFALSVSPLLILLPGIFFAGSTAPITAYLKSIGRPDCLLIKSLIMLPFAVLLNIIIIPHWGIKGAAFTSSVYYSIGAMVAIYFYLRFSRRPFWKTFCPEMNDFRTIKDFLFEWWLNVT
ncbi:MAG: oligosaccharide flippase family protein [Candidatus Edwardsbacteria bacterium]